MGLKLDEEKTVKWSWIGNRSPLMGNKEEAEWVLERLTRTLQRELEEMRKEEEESRGDWAPGGKMDGKQPLQKDGNLVENEGGKEDGQERGGKSEEGPSIESSRTATQEREDEDEN
jgi:potassium channel subfamily K